MQNYFNIHNHISSLYALLEIEHAIKLNLKVKKLSRLVIKFFDIVKTNLTSKCFVLRIMLNYRFLIPKNILNSIFQ